MGDLTDRLTAFYTPAGETRGEQGFFTAVRRRFLEEYAARSVGGEPLTSMKAPFYHALVKLNHALVPIADYVGGGSRRDFDDRIRALRTIVLFAPPPEIPKHGPLPPDWALILGGLYHAAYVNVVLPAELAWQGGSGIPQRARHMVQQVANLIATHPEAQTSPMEFLRLDPRMQAIALVEAELIKQRHERAVAAERERGQQLALSWQQADAGDGESLADVWELHRLRPRLRSYYNVVTGS